MQKPNILCFIAGYGHHLGEDQILFLFPAVQPGEGHDRQLTDQGRSAWPDRRRGINQYMERSLRGSFLLQ